MSRLISNEHTYVAFATTIAAIAAPTAVEVAAAIPLTDLLISLNASSTGNSVPTPSFDTLFETTISGTSTATFTADFYRDDEDDDAWDALPRATAGFFIISRFGGSGTARLPIAADVVEVWPVRITSRSMTNMTNNAAMTFTITCSVPVEPDEAATIV